MVEAGRAGRALQWSSVVSTPVHFPIAGRGTLPVSWLGWIGRKDVTNVEGLNKGQSCSAAGKRLKPYHVICWIIIIFKSFMLDFNIFNSNPLEHIETYLNERRDVSWKNHKSRHFQ